MNSVRQLGTALLYALISVVLVVGGLSLALAEGGFTTPRPTAKPSPTLFSSSTPQGFSSPAVPPQASSTPLVLSVTATQQMGVTQLVTATPQPASATPTATLRLYPTSTTRSSYATPVRCGPYYGWVKNYVVQPGDTLYHISVLYQTTVTALQAANCLPGTFIYPGQMLWVPNVPTITPGATILPTFASPTSEAATLTPIPNATETATPTVTDTAVPVDP